MLHVYGLSLHDPPGMLTVLPSDAVVYGHFSWVFGCRSAPREGLAVPSAQEI